MEPSLPKILIWSAVVIGNVLGRGAELRVHWRNERYLSSVGESLSLGRSLVAYHLVHWSILPAASVEYFASDGRLNLSTLLGGIGAILVGQAVRIWMIHKVGSDWTLGSALTPRQLQVGSYRIAANPEYCSRLMEGIGVCLVLGAKVTLLGFLVATLLFNRHLAKLKHKQNSDIEHSGPASRGVVPVP